MERSAADDGTASDVAVADLPSTSGAHWANRDSLRGGGEQPFRRPPAVNSFPDVAAPEPTGQEQPWDAFASATPAPQPDPMTDTGSHGRASFGVTDGPISGNWFGRDPSPISPAAPFSPPTGAHSAPSDFAAPRGYPASAGTPDPLAVELPVRTDAWTGHWETPQMPQPRTTGSSSFFDQPIDDTGAFGQGAREIRPHRVARHDGDAGRAVHHQGPQPPRRSRLLTVATVTLTALVLVGGAAAGVAYFGGDDKGLGSVLEIGSQSSTDNVATARIDGRATATFELVAATSRATVKTQDLGDELYRITAAGESGAAPRPALTGDKVQLLLETEGAGARGNVEVLLSNKVTWALRFTGGADEQLVDMTGGKINAVDLTGASRRVDLTLPKPTGTVPLRITGAIEDLSLTSPSGSPVRVKVDGGVKTVAAGTRTLKDLEPGSTLTPKDWKVADRYDVSAEARLTLLTVRNK